MYTTHWYKHSRITYEEYISTYIILPGFLTHFIYRSFERGENLVIHFKPTSRPGEGLKDLI